MLCTVLCNKWYHKRCSGNALRGAELCMSKMREGGRGGDGYRDNKGPGLVANAGLLEEIE